MHEFSHVSNMMRDDKETFLSFVADMMEKKGKFLELVHLFAEANGVKMEFYELDGDNYGYDVAMWKVTFVPSEEDQLVFSGYYTETMYQLFHGLSKEIACDGNYETIDAYMNSGEFDHLSQEEFEKAYELKTYEFDKCAAWTNDLTTIKKEFKPSEKG